MNPLLALFSAPSAAAALDAVGGAVNAATQPFADVLSALASPGEPVEQDSSAGLSDPIIDRLQQILAAAGLQQGDIATVRYDDALGTLEIRHEPPLDDAAADAIAADDELIEALTQLASEDEDLRVELLVEAA